MKLLNNISMVLQGGQLKCNINDTTMDPNNLNITIIGNEMFLYKK